MARDRGSLSSAQWACGHTRCPGDPSLPVDRWPRPTPLLTRSPRASLRLCGPTGPLGHCTQVSSRVGPANSNSPSWGSLAVNSQQPQSQPLLPLGQPRQNAAAVALFCWWPLAPVSGVGGAAEGNTAPAVGNLKGHICRILGSCTALARLWGLGRHLSSSPDSDFVDRRGQLLRLMHGQLLGEPQNACVQKQGL